MTIGNAYKSGRVKPKTSKSINKVLSGSSLVTNSSSGLVSHGKPVKAIRQVPSTKQANVKAIAKNAVKARSGKNKR